MICSKWAQTFKTTGPSRSQQNSDKRLERRISATGLYKSWITNVRMRGDILESRKIHTDNSKVWSGNWPENHTYNIEAEYYNYSLSEPHNLIAAEHLQHILAWW